MATRMATTMHSRRRPSLDARLYRIIKHVFRERQDIVKPKASVRVVWMTIQSLQGYLRMNGLMSRYSAT